MRMYSRSITSYLHSIWMNYFWKHPNRLMGLKVSLSVSIILIPFIFMGLAYWGGIMALGVLAASIAETDDHPKGRAKSLSITLISFAIATSSVEILHPFPLFFAIGLWVSSFAFILLGGMGERYRGVTFGTLLVAVYAMLGSNYHTSWYFQPILLTAGALCYGAVSLLLLRSKPWRPLQEQLSVGFKHLAQYVEIKSQFFPSEESEQDNQRNRLAQKNTELVQSIDSIHTVLKNYAYATNANDADFGKYYRCFLLLQQLHERAASTHQSYDVLSDKTENQEIIHGVGQLLRELSRAINLFAESLLTEKEFRPPLSLHWTIAALQSIMDAHKSESEYLALSLLFKNLKEMVAILDRITVADTTTQVAMDYEEASPKKRFRALWSLRHPRFRYALRLSLCFLAGYALIYFLKWEKGEWIILTSLFVMQQNYINTRQRLMERIAGTVVGVVVGIVLIQLMPTLGGDILIVLGSIYMFFYYVKKDYAKAVVFVTTSVIALFNIQANQGFNIIVPRLVDTVIGAMLAFLSVRFILPDWQYKNLPHLLANAIRKNKEYFQAIYTHTFSAAEYAEIRQQAHQADTALTHAWRSIRVEPSAQKTDEKQAFRLTYLNHALLSYLSAFGAHYRDKKVENHYLPTCEEIHAKLNQAQAYLQNAHADNEQIRTEVSDIDKDILMKENESCPTKTTLLLSNIEHLAEELLSETDFILNKK